MSKIYLVVMTILMIAFIFFGYLALKDRGEAKDFCEVHGMSLEGFAPGGFRCYEINNGKATVQPIAIYGGEYYLRETCQ